MMGKKKKKKKLFGADMSLIISTLSSGSVAAPPRGVQPPGASHEELEEIA